MRLWNSPGTTATLRPSASRRPASSSPPGRPRGPDAGPPPGKPAASALPPVRCGPTSPRPARPNALYGVCDRYAGNGTVCAGDHRRHHGTEQLTRRERTGGVMDHDHVHVHRDRRQSPANRGRPGRTACDDTVGELAEPGASHGCLGYDCHDASSHEREASRPHSITGLPPRRENCLGCPKRRPSPAATTIAQVSTLTRRSRALLYGRAALRRSSASASLTPMAKVSSETRICRALVSIRFSPAERPRSLSRIDRFRTTSATW